VPIFLADRLQEIDLKEIPIPFAPDIAVEVLSPSEAAMDVNRKVREYLAAASKEVWVLDQENGELFVHTKAGIGLIAGADVLESALLPGFATPAHELLAGV
jgi:Uma2 family endonuclease